MIDHSRLSGSFRGEDSRSALLRGGQVRQLAHDDVSRISDDFGYSPGPAALAASGRSRAGRVRPPMAACHRPEDSRIVVPAATSVRYHDMGQILDRRPAPWPTQLSRVIAGRNSHETRDASRARYWSGRPSWPGPAGHSHPVVNEARPQGASGPANPLLQLFDTDRDGTLSAAEIDAASAAAPPSAMPTRMGSSLPTNCPAAAGGRGRPAVVAERRWRRDEPIPANRPCPSDDGEKRILAALEQARQGQRYANVSTADGRLLRQLTESLGARRVVELGTSTGESGLWFSMALRKTGGKLYTHDLDPGRIAVARENFKRGRRRRHRRHHRGRRPPDRHQEHRPDRHPVHRRREGRIRRLSEGAAPLRPPRRPDHRPQHATARANPRYLEAITTNPALDTSFVLMDGAGVGITLKKR